MAMNLVIRFVVILSSIWYISAENLECSNKKFTQETAPQRLSDVHRSLTEDLNRERTGAEMKLEVEWKGDFKERKPGEYIIDAKLDGKPKCFRYIIEDVNECLARQTNEAGKDWFHQCHQSTECENKNGTYECSCPMIPTLKRRSTGISSKDFPCEGKYSSKECCHDFENDFLTHSECKKQFQCHDQLCDKKTDCDKNAVCTDFYNASGYSCTCAKGLVGNGKTCSNLDIKYLVISEPNSQKYTFINKKDGTTLESDVSNVCGCQRPTLYDPTTPLDPNSPLGKTHFGKTLLGKTLNSTDCCNGQVPCNEEVSPDGLSIQCKQDFTNVTSINSVDGSLEWKCVDKTPPMVKLLDKSGNFISSELKSHIVDIKQCEFYEDYGYDIEDDNKDKALRKFEMSGTVPNTCLKDIKSYNLTFKTWTGPDVAPWSYHEITRIINVQDINQCLLTHKNTPHCPACLPQCDMNGDVAHSNGHGGRGGNAKCQNELGTYSCKCPVCGQYGDGFLKIKDASLRPNGYINGSGCQDSCSPKITLLGDEITIFKVCTCDGPLCSDDEDEDNVSKDSNPKSLSASSSSSSYKKGDKNYYLKWEKKLLNAFKKSPDLFCAQDGSNNLKFPCAKAQDLSMDGKKLIDISSRIHVGNPIHVKDLIWKIPYDVSDEAGNKAQTIYKEIHIREMTFEEIEKEALTNRRNYHSSSSSSSSSASSSLSSKTTSQSSDGNCPILPEIPACDCSGVDGTNGNIKNQKVHVGNVNMESSNGFDSYGFPFMIFVLICLLLSILCCICVLKDDQASSYRSGNVSSNFTTQTLSSSHATLTSPLTSPFISPSSSASSSSSSNLNNNQNFSSPKIVPRRYPSANQSENAKFMNETERIRNQHLSPEANMMHGNTPLSSSRNHGGGGYDYSGGTSSSSSSNSTPNSMNNGMRRNTPNSMRSPPNDASSIYR